MASKPVVVDDSAGRPPLADCAVASRVVSSSDDPQHRALKTRFPTPEHRPDIAPQLPLLDQSHRSVPAAMIPDYSESLHHPMRSLGLDARPVPSAGSLLPRAALSPATPRQGHVLPAFRDVDRIHQLPLNLIPNSARKEAHSGILQRSRLQTFVNSQCDLTNVTANTNATATPVAEDIK